MNNNDYSQLTVFTAGTALNSSETPLPRGNRYGDLACLRWLLPGFFLALLFAPNGGNTAENGYRFISVQTMLGTCRRCWTIKAI
jgi:hypothetical protein